MDYWEGNKNSHRRTVRQAALWQQTGVNWRAALVLADPDWIDVVGDALLMRGLQLESRDGRIYEHQQLWLVRARSEIIGPPLPPFDVQPWLERLPQA